MVSGQREQGLRGARRSQPMCGLQRMCIWVCMGYLRPYRNTYYNSYVVVIDSSASSTAAPIWVAMGLGLVSA